MVAKLTYYLSESGEKQVVLTDETGYKAITTNDFEVNFKEDLQILWNDCHRQWWQIDNFEFVEIERRAILRTSIEVEY